MEIEELISIKQLAQLLHVDPKTVYRWQWEGKAPRVTWVGKRAHYARSDVRSWLDQRVRCAG